MKIFSVAEMVAAEKAADTAGNSYAQMMETAGRAVAQAIVDREDVEGKQVLVLVGPGNNGGDGLVAGRYLAEVGADVAFYLFRPRDPQEDPNFALVQEMNLFVIIGEYDQRHRALQLRLRTADILIDGLLGTGVSRPIEGDLAVLMREIQSGLQARARETAGRDENGLTGVTAVVSPVSLPDRPVIVAVDCPSGLNCDTGELDKLALTADLTVTFAGPKRGHFRFPGYPACGEIVVADIDIDPSLPEVRTVQLELATAGWARAKLPDRKAYGHKGTFGKVLIVGGSERYWGAPLLSGRGAYRAGAGLVALTVPRSLRPVIAGRLPEATYPLVPEPDDLGQPTARQVLNYMRSYDALLIGPGLGEDHTFIQAFLGGNKYPPLVIDADGLNALAGIENWPKRLPPETILTPHPGEMARLMDIPLVKLQRMDRVAVAQEQAVAWQKIIVLKGAFTAVARPDGHCTLLPFANPILGAAGSGDVLGGIILALLGQGIPAYEAAVLGAYLHGAAGELARTALGDAGLLASELADWVPEARRQIMG